MVVSQIRVKCGSVDAYTQMNPTSWEEGMTMDDMEIRTLSRHLDVMAKKSDAEWMATLNKRKLEELEFHDKDRLIDENSGIPPEEVAGNVKFYKTAGLYSRYIKQWIAEHAKDKIFLDYACGSGTNAVHAATNGAKLAIGLDISKVSIARAKKRAAERNLTNTSFVQGDCENTGLPDNCVDVIFCGGMLHHLELSYAFPELRRILKPGGIILAAEALAYNPAIQAYRLITPSLRTDFEKRHILSLADVHFAKRFFDVSNMKFWHLFSIGVTPFIERSWSKYILALANALDGIVLRIPLIRLMAWMFTFEMRKRND